MTNPMIPRKVLGPFMVDANCVNARQGIAALNQLESWAEDEVISRLFTAQVAQGEMLAGGDARRRAKAYTFMFTESDRDPDDQEFFDRFEALIFPQGALKPGEQKDVELVFNAFKYRYVLITTDGASKAQPGGILGAREKLVPFGITIVRPQEAVAMVREAIERRDESARRMALATGLPVPHWVGKD